MRIALIWFIIVFPNVVFGQKMVPGPRVSYGDNPIRDQKRIRADYTNILESWIPGELILNDGTRVTGDIQYNQFENTLRLKQEDHIRALQPKDFQTFTLWDDGTTKERKFITIPFDFYENGFEEATLFEALIEFEDFALMSTFSKLAIVESPPAGHAPNTPAPQPVYEGAQTECIYVFDDQGLIRKYMTINHSNPSGFNIRLKAKNKVHEANLLKEYIPAEDYANLESYAEENHLSFKEPSDLIIILDHYKEELKRR